MVEVGAERDAARVELATANAQLTACRLALGIADDEQIVTEGAKHGWILVDGPGGQRKAKSPTTEENVRLAAEVERLEEDTKNLKEARMFGSDKEAIGRPDEWSTLCEQVLNYLGGFDDLSDKMSTESCGLVSKVAALTAELDQLRQRAERAEAILSKWPIEPFYWEPTGKDSDIANTDKINVTTGEACKWRDDIENITSVIALREIVLRLINDRDGRISMCRLETARAERAEGERDQRQAAHDEYNRCARRSIAELQMAISITSSPASKRH